jgi:hypothetical protein
MRSAARVAIAMIVSDDVEAGHLVRLVIEIDDARLRIAAELARAERVIARERELAGGGHGVAELGELVRLEHRKRRAAGIEPPRARRDEDLEHAHHAGVQAIAVGARDRVRDRRAAGDVAPHTAVRRLVAHAQADRRHVLEPVEHVHQPAPAELEDLRGDVRRRLRGRDQLAFAQEVIAAIALRDVIRRIDVLVEQAGDARRRMEREVPADLAAGVREPLAEQEQRRRDAAAGEHDHARAHAVAPAARRRAFDADGAAALDDHAVDAKPGEQHGAASERGRDVRQVRAALGVGAAAEVAEAEAGAAARVAADREVPPAERVAAARDHARDRADFGLRGRCDVENALDALEVRLHRLAREIVGAQLLAPSIEHPRGRAKAGAAVDRGRTADEAADEDRHHDVADRRGGSIEPLVRAYEAAVERVAAIVLAFFDEADREAALGELVADDGAAGTGADHDRVQLEVVAGPVVGGVDLREPARLVEIADDVRAPAHRAHDVGAIEVRELVDDRRDVERLAQHRIVLPRAHQLLGGFVLERRQPAAGACDRREIEDALRRRPRLREPRREPGDDALGAAHRLGIGRGDSLAAGKQRACERECGAIGQGGDFTSTSPPRRFDSRSTNTNSAGMKKMPSSVAALMPEITAVPSTRRACAPAPAADHSGTQPRMNANDVIKIGRRRSRAASSAASISDLPCS